MLKLALGLVPGAIVLVCAIVMLAPLNAFAASCPPGATAMRASWYGMETCAGKRDCRTADGTRFNGEQLLVAHRSWPFGTKLKITYRGKSVFAVVKDRGPFVPGRDIDLSRAVAARIGMLGAGVATVCVERV